MVKQQQVILGCVLLILCILCSKVNGVASLPAFNVNINNTTVSGLSSGAFFAVQMHVAFSSIITGAGIFAGGPYDCAEGNLNLALSSCMKGTPNVNTAISTTNSRYTSGKIDNPANMQYHRVYLYSGTKDTTVYPSVMKALDSYYGNFVTTSNILFEDTVVSAHTQPTTDAATNACTVSSSPYVSYCNYDGAGIALSHIYGDLNPRNNGALTGQMLQFDQTEFLSNPTSQSIATTGYVYIPAACASNATCVLHIAFHGCLQNYENVGDAYITESGYNEWADTNNIIILYPQTVASTLNPQNPNACWNWWGYNNDPNTYDIQSGSQMNMIYKMIQRIGSGYSPIPIPTGLLVAAETNSSIYLEWSSVPGATGFNVFRDGVLANSGPITTTQFNDTGLPSGSTFVYQIVAIENGSQSAPSVSVSGTTGGPPPPLTPPTNLQASAITATSVTLTWSSVPGATGYYIYRNSVKLNTNLDSTTTYTDSGLDSSTSYDYSVVAATSTTDSTPSSTIAVTTLSSFVCSSVTASNYAHVQANRAYVQLGSCFAVGSNDAMGLYNTFVTNTLAETSENYWIVGDC